MIDLKTAVSAAYQYIRGLQEVMGNPLNDLRLEEVELSEDRRFWLITLGFDIPNKKSKNNKQFDLALPTVTSRREYKIFKVNSQTGEVEAMKIREV